MDIAAEARIAKSHHTAAENNSNDKRDRTVLDLIRLTNRGRLTWESSGSPVPNYEVQYIAYIGVANFTLTVMRQPSDIRDQIILNSTLPAGINRNPLLTMKRGPESEAIVFPDLDSLSSLALAVHRQAKPEDVDDLLDQIHAIATGDFSDGSGDGNGSGSAG